MWVKEILEQVAKAKGLRLVPTRNGKMGIETLTILGSKYLLVKSKKRERVLK